eukprot:jgi/Tetstr1/466085/TSEL_010670.t1
MDVDGGDGGGAAAQSGSRASASGARQGSGRGPTQGTAGSVGPQSRAARRAALQEAAARDAAVPNEDRWWLSDDEEVDGSSDGEDSDSDSDSARGEAQRLASAAEQEEWMLDPDADERDAVWADAARGGRPSDAILSCPACLTTLCLECQQHELYEGQFRAMFVRNCALGGPTAAAARPGGATAGAKRGLDGQPGGAAGGASGRTRGGAGAGGDGLRAVRCGTCGAEVGVLDAEEVYHFFNVFPSAA